MNLRSVSDDAGCTFKTLQTQVKRIKTQSHNPQPDDIIHFVHKSDIMKCLHFALFYYLVLDRTPCSSVSAGVEEADKEKIKNCLFPAFSDTVNFSSLSGTDSKISEKFRESWGRLIDIARTYIVPDDAQKIPNHYCADYAETVLDDKAPEIIYTVEHFARENKTKGSHSAKKYGVQLLGDSGLMPQVRV